MWPKRTSTSTWKAFIVIMSPTVGVNEAVKNWTVGTLPCATPTKPASICKLDILNDLLYEFICK